jgi:hypothetical protein
MIVFASGPIPYNTSNLIHRYQPGQHVAASLSLFVSVALLFWSVLRLLAHGTRGNFEKSGGRFSMNACFPSRPSSLM